MFSTVLNNLPFLSVVTGFISSFLWFNSLSFQEDSIIGDDFNTQVALTCISLVNLCNGLCNQIYISKSQIKFLGCFGILLIVSTVLLEVADYYDILENLGKIINLRRVCEDNL